MSKKNKTKSLSAEYTWSELVRKHPCLQALLLNGWIEPKSFTEQYNQADMQKTREFLNNELGAEGLRVRPLWGLQIQHATYAEVAPPPVAAPKDVSELANFPNIFAWLMTIMCLDSPLMSVLLAHLGFTVTPIAGEPQKKSLIVS